MADATAPPIRPALPRPSGVGIPEVVGLPLTGDGAIVAVRALQLGTRIDTRQLAAFQEPERLALSGSAAAFVFRYGVLVLFAATPAVERELIAQLEPHVIEPLPVPEIETASLEIRPGCDEQVSASGNILMREASAQRLVLIATVLARSTVLARDESRIEEALDGIEPFIAGLRLQGRATLPIRRIMQQIGDVLTARHRVVGRAQISEKPDLLWEHPELDRLYARLEAEFELSERTRAVERKLEVIGDTADVLLELVQDRRSVRLELAVIALIAFELIVSVIHFWRG